MSEDFYYVSYSSVDGAGRYDEHHDDEQAAIDQADALQESANDSGNEWGYSFKVNHDLGGARNDTVYNARSREHS